MVNNEIYIRRKGKVYLEKQSAAEVTNAQLGALLKNLESLGYCFSKELIEVFYTFSVKEFERTAQEFIQNIRKMLGAHVRYRPMYPEFPKQVMECSEAKLYLNALLHYLSSGRILPSQTNFKKQKGENYETGRKSETGKYSETRGNSESDKPLKILELGSIEEFEQIMVDLMLAKSSISKTDREDLRWYLLHAISVEQLPEDIPMHETKVFMCRVLLDRLANANEEMRGREAEQISGQIRHYLSTATDLLRFAAAASGGDSSLAVPVKFRRFRRCERRLLLEVLNTYKNPLEDMKRYRERWIRLGERLHPGEFPKYAKAAKAFECLRNDRQIPTFAGRIEEFFQNGEVQKLLAQLRQRPGEFARKLDRLLRTFPEASEDILENFQDVADQVASPLLLQLRTHFLWRAVVSLEPDYRVFFPKGNLARAHLEEGSLPPIAPACCELLVEVLEEALIRIYGKRKALGKVYIAPEFEDYLVPFSQRSASKALKTLVRGSKLCLPQKAGIIRAFIYWKDGKERTDIDLSAVMLDDGWRWLEHISYTNLKSNQMHACHSGDIVAAPQGASEFIDIDLDTALKNKVRYIVFTVNSYTLQPYCDLPECFMGYMELDGEKVGKKASSESPYQPKKVRNKIDITANTRICVPMLLDLWEWKLVWMDMALRRMPSFNCVENNAGGIIATCKAFTAMKRPNLLELMELNVRARGELVSEKDSADLCFDLDGGITPYDTERFLADYL